MPTIEDAIARYAASIDEMLAGPFAGWDWAPGTSDHFTGRTLHASPELWQVDAGVAAAWRATIDSHLRALVAELAGPWGAPDAVDLSVVLQQGLEGNDVLPPVDHLSDVTGVLFLWREPGVDRWVGLAAAQADRELPVELIAVVGDDLAWLAHSIEDTPAQP